MYRYTTSICIFMMWQIRMICISLYLTVLLICISLAADDVQCLFPVFTGHLSVVFGEKDLEPFLLFKKLCCLCIYWVIRILHTLHTDSLSDIWSTIFFSPSFGCLLTFLVVSLKHKLKFWWSSLYLFLLLLLPVLLVSHLRNIASSVITKFILMFSSKLYGLNTYI